jgi:propionate catabolism operon transcriptional regulator
LFLDEIGELPLPLQTRLLRVLEEREVLRVGATEPTPVDLRVVAATLQSLEQRAAAGSFRRDLYYRLAALRIALPTLRARRGDIPLLTTHFFRELRGIDAPLDAEALALLSAADWPGNVRELRNLVDRLRIHWQPSEGLIDAARLLQLAPELVNEGAATLPVENNGKRPPRAQLQALLQEHRNDREGMAQALGVSRTTLWRWLRAEGL